MNKTIPNKISEEIHQLDLCLDDVLKKPLNDIEKHLVENYQVKQIHQMYRLLKQRRSHFAKDPKVKDDLLFIENIFWRAEKTRELKNDKFVEYYFDQKEDKNAVSDTQ